MKQEQEIVFSVQLVCISGRQDSFDETPGEYDDWQINETLHKTISWKMNNFYDLESKTGIGSFP